MSRLEANLKWWKFRRVVFYLVDRSLQWSFKATVVPNQLGGRDVLSRFAGKEDKKKKKKTELCNFISKWSVKTSSVLCIEQILKIKVGQQDIIV